MSGAEKMIKGRKLQENIDVRQVYRNSNDYYFEINFLFVQEI